MSMLRDNDYKDNPKNRLKFAIACIISVIAVLGILFMTIAANVKTRTKSSSSSTSSKFVVEEEATDTVSEDYLTADDLNFWHAYDPVEEKGSVIPQSGFDPDNSRREDDRVDKRQPTEDDSISANTASSNEAPDGTFNVAQADEEPEYVNIISSLPENSYFDEGFTKTDKGYKEYALNGRKSSYTGIDLSKYDSSHIDFSRVKNAGIDFCMIRLGARGYQSGKITVDDNFYTNMIGCSENGIKIGMYFYSQAVNAAEAVEEATYCVSATNGYKVEYPIVFYSESIENDSSRVDNLTKEQYAEVAKAFCDTISAYGYTPMIAGTKRQLANRMDLTTIANYDWWLLDTDEKTTFPYRFKMWQYSRKGKVEGIMDPVDLDISFVDYSVR